MRAESQRLVSVDALRGMAVAAMLLVNDPGDWDHVYAPLEHSAWHGCTPTDLIFPLFLFIVGASLALAMGPRLDAGAGADRGALATTAIRRGLRIVGVGVGLHLLAWWVMGKPEFRLLGVLQRIGLCFMAVGCVVPWLKPRGRWALLAVLLAGYAALILMGGTLDKIGSLEQRVDTLLLGRWAYEWNAGTGIGFDPEGVVSTLGALATCLIGWLCGDLLRRRQLVQLTIVGAASAALGWVWAEFQMPLNKQLWTPSFVLWNAGIDVALMLLAHFVFDRLRWPPLGRAFGVNAIAAYAGAWITTVFLEGFGWMEPVYAHGFGWLQPLVGPYGRSLAFALAFVAVWWLIVRQLDKRGVYIKV
jgi:predicted acyltransferase